MPFAITHLRRLTVAPSWRLLSLYFYFGIHVLREANLTNEGERKKKVLRYICTSALFIHPFISLQRQANLTQQKMVNGTHLLGIIYQQGVSSELAVERTQLK